MGLMRRKIFEDSDRFLRLYFDTTSKAKFEQAEYVLTKLGLKVWQRSSSRSITGEEDYEGDIERLMKSKASSARLGLATPFFVEDTYVRIEGISAPTTSDVGSQQWVRSTSPGLTTKEWFRSTTFESLDATLRSNGNNRRATVFSTIGLHLPGLERLILFTGSTTGVVADEPAP